MSSNTSFSALNSEQQSKLTHYVSMLLKWQQSINLISPGTVDLVWVRHIEDSLQLLSHLSHNASHILDIGSGGGLPAIPISICSEHVITCVESDKRKSIFLEQVAIELDLNVTVICNRMEHVSRETSFSYIISRACARLTRLLDYSERFLSPETICLFPKGETYRKELEDARKDWQFECEIIPSKTDKNAAILKITHLARQSI